MVGVDRDMAALAIAMANKIECKGDYRWIVEGTKKGSKYNICYLNSKIIVFYMFSSFCKKMKKWAHHKR